MEVIGVSGSTKCDWAILQEGAIFLRFSTRGINPIFHNEEEITSIIQSSAELTDHDRQISAVYVYGAGCSSKTRQNVVRKSLFEVFPKAHHYVNHDMVGSALAVYNGTPCICAILGTGANACFFDGDIVRQAVPALDFILGDEGGGTWYGKKLISSFLYKLLPTDLHEAFSQRYMTGFEDILEHVYMKPYPNVYLASYMSFIQENVGHPFIDQLLKEGFGKFMDIYITQIKNYTNFTIHFTGSVAYHYQTYLKEAARERNIEVGEIIKEPIDRLVAYHLNKHFNQV